MQIALLCRKKKHSFFSDFCSRPNFRKLTAKFGLLKISCVVYSVFCCIACVNAKRFVFHCLFACWKFRSYLDLFVESVKSNWDLSVRLHWKFMFVLWNMRRNICDKAMTKRLCGQSQHFLQFIQNSCASYFVWDPKQMKNNL